MHSTSFHFPFSAKQYLITSLSSQDVLSICNPVLQLRADYTYIQLTSKPVVEADINFEWVQISGTAPLDFIDADTATPTIVANLEVVDDLVFRVYIDRDTPDEFFADMTVFRTPTDVASTGGNSDYLAHTGFAAVGTNSLSFTNNLRLNKYVPTDVTTIPSILSSLTGTETIFSTELTSFTAVVSHSLNLIKEKHAVTAIRAYNPETGILIAATNKSNIIEIPLNVSVFYLVFDITLNYYNPNLANKFVTVSDSKVRPSYIIRYTKEINELHLYVSEGLLPTPKNSRESVYPANKQLTVSLPQSRQTAETITSGGNFSPVVNAATKQLNNFVPITLDAGIETITNAANFSRVGLLDSYILTRFNGISIGG